MRRFNPKRRRDLSKYKVIIIGIILVIFTFNIINFCLKSSDTNKFYNILITNIYGDLFTEFNSFNNIKKGFYKNILGFNLEEEKVKEESVSSLENLTKSSEDKPLVYIYNTFQTDKYKVNYYNSYTVSPIITQASLILKEYLGEYGINSLVELNSVAEVLKNNDISYFTSYRGSRILLERAKEENQSLKYYFDIQMLDSSDYLVNESYAQVLFVVGLEHENYKENESLAYSLNEKLEEKVNNVSRGISLRGGAGYHGVYNQDFSANALLIQVGGRENTIREVNATLKILAEVIASHIKEDMNEEEGEE